MKQKLKAMPILTVPVPHRLCWECAHVKYIVGDTGYSEFTPGSDMSLKCGKGYWEFDQFSDELDTLRTCLTTAESCADFTARKEQP